jgi:uncharacterized protein YqgC (DUF456 family)
VKTKIFSLLLALTIVLTASPCALAQGARGNWQAVQSLVPGTELIVETKGGEAIKSILSRASDTTMDLTRTSGGGAVTLSRDEVRKVFLAKRGSKSRRTKIGAWIGAGAGLVVAVAVAAKVGQNSDAAPGVILFPVLGCGAGALVGAATGGKVKKGELVYESN